MRTTNKDVITSNLEKYGRRVEMCEGFTEKVVYDMVFRDFQKEKRKKV